MHEHFMFTLITHNAHNKNAKTRFPGIINNILCTHLNILKIINFPSLLFGL